MWAEQVSSDSGDDQINGGPPTGDVKGYEVQGNGKAPEKAESSKKAPSVATPEHTAEATLVEEPPQAPFLAPGPALVDLPPTEKELRDAATEDNKSERTTKDTSTADDASAAPATTVPATFADIVKAATSTITTIASSVKVPSIKAPTLSAPSVQDNATSVVEDLNSVKDLSLNDPPTPSVKPATPSVTEGAPSVRNDAAEKSVEPTYAAAVTEEPESHPITTGGSMPISFPTSAPVSFPTSDDASSTHRRMQSSDSIPTMSPGVTFKGTESPARSGTPDDPSKRKRISSQNFQRLARRISIGRRPSAASGAAIFGSKDDSGSKEGSSKGGEDDSITGTSEDKKDKKDKKKDKKEKKEKEKEKDKKASKS